MAALGVLILLLTPLVWRQYFAVETAPGAEPRAPGLPTEILFAGIAGTQPAALGADQHRAMAEAYLSIGDGDAALAHLWVAAEETNAPAIWRQLATMYQARADWNAARQALTGILHALPEDPAAHFELGVLLAAHDMRQAHDHLSFAWGDPVLEEDARRLQAAISEAELAAPAYQYARIGTALMALEYWSQAEYAFDAAVTLDPGYADGWAYLGLARAKQDKDASLAFDQALALAPEEPLVLYLYGLMWRAVGDYARSQLMLAEAQRRAPDNPALAAELGNACRLNGDLPAAERWLQAAVALAPADQQFLTMLAMFYAEESYNLEGNGLTVLQEAVARQPGDADLQTAYAWALFNRGALAASEEAITTALLLQSDNPRALYYRGLMYQNQGQPAMALETWARLLDHPRPEGFDVLARRALERLGYNP